MNISGSYIGKSTKITGTLVFCKDMRLDGYVSGFISGSPDSRLVVAVSGKVDGDMTAGRIEIHGSVKGRVKADGVLIYAPGIIHGYVDSESLFVEDGAVIFGVGI